MYIYIHTHHSSCWNILLNKQWLFSWNETYNQVLHCCTLLDILETRVSRFLFPFFASLVVHRGSFGFNLRPRLEVHDPKDATERLLVDDDHLLQGADQLPSSICYVFFFCCEMQISSFCRDMAITSQKKYAHESDKNSRCCEIKKHIHNIPIGSHW